MDLILHECEVKEGISFLIPILNVICNDHVKVHNFGENYKTKEYM
ncbi:MAG TPA: hypothetical protein VFK40_03485 [Nitrososphaeraceae archaeon]|nr:hypothetical protein [Nitrososphaeraceae archaeon]